MAMTAMEEYDYINPPLDNQALWKRYQAIHSYSENIMGPAFKAQMTKRGGTLPSGIQWTDVFIAIIAFAWATKEAIRIEHLVKSRAKTPPKTQSRASLDPNPMPKHWIESSMVAYFFHGDVAEEQEVAFCLNAGAATSDKKVDILDLKTGKETGKTVKITSRRYQRDQAERERMGFDANIKQGGPPKSAVEDAILRSMEKSDAYLEDRMFVESQAREKMMIDTLVTNAEKMFAIDPVRYQDSYIAALFLYVIVQRPHRWPRELLGWVRQRFVLPMDLQA